MSVEDSDRLTRLLLERFGGGDFTVVDEIVAEDLIEHQHGLPQGREGLKTLIRSIRDAFPDISYTAIQMVQDGDKVWGHFQACGTNTGSFMGQPATGKTMTIDVIDIGRFNNGKLVEHWGVPDRLALLLQIGLFPR